MRRTLPAATSSAIALRADKLVFLLDFGGTVDADGNPVSRLTASQAQKLARELPEGDMKLYLPHAVKACRKGVARAHLVSADVDGALLMELFTHEGVGAMVSRQSVETLRPASIDDVGGILQLIEPLEQEGVLVHRPRELLEQEIDRFFVAELDGRLIGCVAIYPFPDAQAGEMACLAVHPDFRDNGRGEALVSAAEEAALAQGLKRLFVLTTRTAHWFIERGYATGTPDDLPATRKEMYNWQRRSKIFVKDLKKK